MILLSSFFSTISLTLYNLRNTVGVIELSFLKFLCDLICNFDEGNTYVGAIKSMYDCKYYGNKLIDDDTPIGSLVFESNEFFNL